MIFVNNCLLSRSPILFHNYFKERVTRYYLRNPRLHVPPHRTDYLSHSTKISGAMLWNKLPVTVKNHRTKLNFGNHLKGHFINMYT